jgi:hypothetical protein
MAVQGLTRHQSQNVVVWDLKTADVLFSYNVDFCGIPEDNSYLPFHFVLEKSRILLIRKSLLCVATFWV